MQNDFLLSSKLVCPSGWKEFKDNCYGFAPRYMSFTKAKQFCVAKKVKIVLLGWKAAWSILVCISLSFLEEMFGICVQTHRQSKNKDSKLCL